MSSLSPGTVIDGSFTLLRLIGEGGMGEVWLARENALGREVALKLMLPSGSRTREERFGREARALAALDHPSILPVLRSGTDPATGRHYFATPAVLLSPSEITRVCDEVLHCPYPRGFLPPNADEGGFEHAAAPRPLPLSVLLEGGKTLPQDAVLRIARDLAGALAAAHAASILHRDLKPSNILFDASGRAILADFGLAKFTRGEGLFHAKGAEDQSHAESAESAESLSASPDGRAPSRSPDGRAPSRSPDGRAPSRPERGSGAAEAPDSISLDESGARKFLGSPAYAAPEQFRAGAALTPAIDWYALGAVLYEALTGERPRSLRPPSSYDPPRISRAWDPFLRDLFEPDPVRRLADPAAIAQKLDSLARAIDPVARRRRRAAWAAVAAVAVLAANAAAAASFHARNRDKTTATTPSTKRDANRCTITFDWQGGRNGIASSSGNYGAPIRWSIPRLPSRTGHSFDGFYTQPNGAGEKYFSADGSPVPGHGYTCDMTLYANWTANTYAGSSAPSP